LPPPKVYLFFLFFFFCECLYVMACVYAFGCTSQSKRVYVCMCCCVHGFDENPIVPPVGRPATE
jgi:hypothetical protein